MANPITLIKNKFFLSRKTQIGGYIFDCYTSIQHSLTSTITSHPTQYGANFSDYQYEEPDVLTFQIGMSDSMIDFISGQFTGSVAKPTSRVKNIEGLLTAQTIDEFDSLYEEYTPFIDKVKYLKAKAINALTAHRSVNAYNVLRKLKLLGIPFDCVTRLGTYHNMLIKDIVVNDNNTTYNGLSATVTCQQVLITEVQKVQVKVTSQITQTTDKGSQNAFNFDLEKNGRLQSILFLRDGKYIP